MFVRLRSSRMGLVIGSAAVLAIVAGLTTVIVQRSSSLRVAFVHSRFTLPLGWSAGVVTRTRASQFQAATETMMIHGPGHFHMQLTYTSDAPNFGNYGWIPPGPPDSMVFGESRLSSWSSPYRLMTWTAARNPGQGTLAGTVVTLHGTYDWMTSVFSRAQHPRLYQTTVRWATTARYPSVITPTQAVHAMMHPLRRYRTQTLTRVLAWHSAAGAMLTPGIPGTGEAPWYLFTTENHGRSWQLTHMSSTAPMRQRNGFPDASPSDVLVAMAMSSTRTIWIAQTINCMSGPEARGGTVTLARTINDGKFWQRIANRIQEPAGYCPTDLRLSATPGATQPTVRLIERNAAGTPKALAWTGPTTMEEPRINKAGVVSGIPMISESKGDRGILATLLANTDDRKDHL